MSIEGEHAGVKQGSLLFRRLVPAALGAAAFAAIAHAVLVAIAARSVGLELLAIASLTFPVALVVACSAGAVLLAIVTSLKLKLLPSMALFVIAAELATIWLEFFFFEFTNDWRDLSWQYSLISVPASLLAWHQSVYHVQRHR